MGLYRAYEVCFVLGEEHKICSELRGIYDVYNELSEAIAHAEWATDGIKRRVDRQYENIDSLERSIENS